MLHWQLYVWWDGASGEVVATLVGQWGNVIECRSANKRLTVASANTRLEGRSHNQRITAESANARLTCQSSNKRLET